MFDFRYISSLSFFFYTSTRRGGNPERARVCARLMRSRPRSVEDLGVDFFFHRGQYSDAVLSELENQNDAQIEGMSAKVKMLKDVRLPSSIFPPLSFFVFSPGTREPARFPSYEKVSFIFSIRLNLFLYKI